MAGFEDKVAVVTGASRGLGATFARVFAEEGFAIALGARDFTALQRLAAELPGAFAHPLDVGDRASVEAFRRAVLDRFGRRRSCCGAQGKRRNSRRKLDNYISIAS